MKKIITWFIFFILFLFSLICIMVGIDKNNIDEMKEDILKNTDIKKIVYINNYDNNYIVMDDNYVYLFDSKYRELNKIKIDLLHDNNNDYELVYIDEELMYMDNYKSDKGVIFKYYDIYTYKLKFEKVVGGN